MDKRDLIVLLADLDAENAVRSLLDYRTADLHIRPIRFDIVRHSMRDSGCFRQAHELLRSYLRTHCHALVMFDRHVCGNDSGDVKTIEDAVETRLTKNGWVTDNSACVVLDPELEIWMWTQSDEIARILEFGPDYAVLRNFLLFRGLLKEGCIKPADPKEAVEQCRRRSRIQRSPRIFSKLAVCLQFGCCEDRSFLKFRHILEVWFGDKNRDVPHLQE